MWCYMTQDIMATSPTGESDDPPPVKKQNLTESAENQDTGAVEEPKRKMPSEEVPISAKKLKTDSDEVMEILRREYSTGLPEEVRTYLANVESGSWLEKCADGNTPLHVAVVKGYLEILRMVTGAGLGPSEVANVKGFAGRTLLHQACKGGHSNLVRVLIEEFRSDINAFDGHQYTPPLLAALNGHEELVTMFVKEYSYPIGPIGEGSSTLLHMASLGGHISLVGTLVRDHDAEVDAKDSKNNTPVSLAVWRGHIKVVESLIKDLKCNPYIRGYKNRTLLHQACLAGHLELVQMLISRYKFRMNSRDKQSVAPICLAARKGRIKIVTNLLTKYHCKPNITGWKDKTLVHYACEGGHYGLVHYLITECDLSLDAKDKDGNTPLSVAIKHHHSNMVYKLIAEFPIDPTVTDSRGRTLLHLAYEYSYIKLAELILLIPHADDLHLNTLRDKDGKMPADLASKDETGDRTFLEANVLDMVIRVSNYHDLGWKLRIPSHKLAEIDKHPVQDRRQLFVEALFRDAPKEKCTWEALNSAINEVGVKEWAARTHGGMTKSISTESNMSMMSNDNSAMKLPVKMKMVNKAQINTMYLKLKSAIKQRLKATELDINDFYEHIISIFKSEEEDSTIVKLIPDVSSTEGIDEVFKVLTKNRLWGFGDVSQLKSLADRFIEEDSSLQEMIRDYKSSLNGYRATTKIIDRMRSGEIKVADDDGDDEYESIASNSTKYNKKYRRSLSAKLFKASGDSNVLLSMKSLEYVEMIWNHLCDEFDMSSLAAVLDTIESQVTWLVAPVSASKVLAHIGEAGEFLRSKFISNIMIEDIMIYSDSGGVADQKTLDEVQLLLAVQEESLDKTNLALKSFTGNINEQLLTKNDMTVLMIAAHDGCTEIVSALLLQGAAVNQQDASGWSALFHAVDGGHEDTVCHLLEDEEHKVELTLKDRTGATILDRAMQSGHSELRSVLATKLEHHLVTRAKEGDLSSVEQILHMGANVDATDPYKALWTSLMWASWRGHLDVVKYLLKMNANVNATSESGWTSLILASREGHYEVMKMLLDCGANVNAKTEGGWSSLMNAADAGHVEAGRLLIERGANI